jgi:hypothetical protein
MTRQLAAILLFTASLPIVVSAPRDTTSVPARDQPGERLLLAAGGGDYDVFQVLSSCEGPSTTERTHISHTDVGGQVEIESNAGGYVFGVRGGALHEQQGVLYTNGVAQSGSERSRQLNYWNPYVSMEKRLIGLGGGAVFANDEFVVPGLQTGKRPMSGHFRLGYRDGLYLGIRYMEAVPLVAGGDYGDVGVGLNLPRYGGAWVGMGFDGPADQQTYAFRGQLRVVPALSIVGGAFRGSGSASDGQPVRNAGWHVGLELKHARAPEPSPATSP